MEQEQLTAFQQLVALKYQLYNSLFVTLPFKNLQVVGVELPVFSELCRKELRKGKSPKEIMDKFFHGIVHTSEFSRQIKILFLLIQFVERQVVLFDALEDAAFKNTHDMAAEGTLKHWINSVKASDNFEAVRSTLEEYHVRIVLTAHPTQFYPPQVLGIIQNLSDVLQDNELAKIRNILMQLGKTSFRNLEKPTPIDEANVLIHYLKTVFYPIFKKIHYELGTTFFSKESPQKKPSRILELGFWPGGDRDGNPFVTADITMQIAKSLKFKIIGLYIKEIKKLKKIYTFPKRWNQLDEIKYRLIATQQILRSKRGLLATPYKNYREFLLDLRTLRKQLITQDDSLFIENLDIVISVVNTFGFHFAMMDLRQDSRIHADVINKLIKGTPKFRYDYVNLPAARKTKLLIQLLQRARHPLKKGWDNQPLTADAICSLRAAYKIQQINGEKGLCRYIISNTQAAYQVLEVMVLAYWSGFALEKLSLDVVPLFEMISDLDNADKIMRELLSIPIYRQHLKRRKNRQIVMLGFSDGTKDGGYITANWKIFQCKIRLSRLARELGIDIIFFDGRGGPPARGGGNTHKFYRAMEGLIEQKSIQLTIQGQTISSNFGTLLSARYNVEQLMTSGLYEHLSKKASNPFSKMDQNLLENFSCLAFDAYQKLKQHPLFVSYLEEMTPLPYYAELNIASRPARRKMSGPASFDDLRAIPFVSAWAQMKQNVPGFYGLGTALKALVDQGKEDLLKKLYQKSLFFRTLLENAMQSLKKSNFHLTQYLGQDKTYGEFWQMLFQEAELSAEMLKRISEQTVLLETDPIIRTSIELREDLVLPLLVIQQYAMQVLRTDRKLLEKKNKDVFVKIVLRSMAANINATRNSA